MKLPLYIIAACLIFITIFQGAIYSLEKEYLSVPMQIPECSAQKESFI